MTRPSKELRWDEYMFIKNNACIESGLAGPCTIIFAQGADMRTACLGHFLRLFTEGMPNARILSMFREIREVFGKQLHVLVRGNAYFPHMGEQLRELQLTQRRLFSDLLEAYGISADIQWAADNILTKIIFDARTGERNIQEMQYTPRTQRRRKGKKH